MDIDIGGQAVPFLIHGRGIGTSLTHIPSGYRIALLGGWLTARYEIPENKPSRTACAQTDWWPSTAHCSCWTGSMASGY